MTQGEIAGELVGACARGNRGIMTGNILTRQARLSDAQPIFDLVGANSDMLIPRSMGDIVSNIDRFVVADDGSRICGCAAFVVHPEIGAPESATVEIQSLAVRADCRGAGIGRALVEAILRKAAPFGAKEAIVLTFVPGFFASLGFAETPKTKVMHKLYTGCINCTKHANPFTCPEIAMTRAI